jgi:nitrate/nitrite-specific signal transduction histidine kinase
MNENELLEMGRNLAEKYKQLENDVEKFDTRVNTLQRYMVMLYTYSRELDMLIGSDPNYPIIIKFMIERLRGITSQLLFKEARAPELDDEDDVNMFIS